MSDWFVGEIRLFALMNTNMLQDWALCDGRILSTRNNPLFLVIGNTFGGNGKTTFALPDLRGRVAVHPQLGDSERITIQPGENKGEETHHLTAAEVPSHTHQARGSTLKGTSNKVAGNVWATGDSGQNLYGVFPASPSDMNSEAVIPQGGGQRHENMQPFQVLNYCIAIHGIMPPRS